LTLHSSGAGLKVAFFADAGKELVQPYRTSIAFSHGICKVFSAAGISEWAAGKVAWFASSSQHPGRK
jgi:hypothetical protein